MRDTVFVLMLIALLGIALILNTLGCIKNRRRIDELEKAPSAIVCEHCGEIIKGE